MLKIGLIGTGYIGKVHAECWSRMKGAMLYAVCDNNVEKAIRFSEQYKAKTFNNITEILNSGIDILDVCIPTPFHLNVVEHALKKKIPVLCEKPIANNYSDAEKMLAISQSNNTLFMIAHCVRFDPNYAYLKKIVQEGVFGDLLSLRIYRNSAIPKYSEGQWLLKKEVSGGVAMDLHVHDVDIVNWLLQEPDWVFSVANMGKITSNYGYMDKIITSEASWRAQDQYPFNAGYDAYFENASITFSGSKIQIYTDNKCTLMDDVLKELNTDIIKTNDAYFNEIMYFLNCLINRVEPTYCLPEDSLRTHKILLAELKSAEMNQIITDMNI